MPVAIRVALTGIAGVRAEVADIAHTVGVRVRLVLVVDDGAVVAEVTEVVVVLIGLIRVVDARAVVEIVADGIAVAINTGRAADEGLERIRVRVEAIAGQDAGVRHTIEADLVVERRVAGVQLGIGAIRLDGERLVVPQVRGDLVPAARVALIAERRQLGAPSVRIAAGRERIGGVPDPRRVDLGDGARRRNATIAGERGVVVDGVGLADAEIREDTGIPPDSVRDTRCVVTLAGDLAEIVDVPGRAVLSGHEQRQGRAHAPDPGEGSGLRTRVTVADHLAVAGDPNRRDVREPGDIDRRDRPLVVGPGVLNRVGRIQVVARHRPGGVDGHGETQLGGARIEGGHHPVVPDERVIQVVVRGGAPHGRPGVVDRVGAAELRCADARAEHTEIGHHAVAVAVAVLGPVDHRRAADDLAQVVDGLGSRRAAAQIADVREDLRLGQRRHHEQGGGRHANRMLTRILLQGDPSGHRAR